MKKEFLTPKIQVVYHDEMDIIMTSSNDHEKDPFEVEGMQIYVVE